MQQRSKNHKVWKEMNIFRGQTLEARKSIRKIIKILSKLRAVRELERREKGNRELLMLYDLWFLLCLNATFLLIYKQKKAVM